MNVEFPIPLSGERRASLSAPPPEVAPHSTRSSAANPGSFHRVLLAVGAEVDRGERLIQGVVSGRTGSLGAGELIALQAGIYRYTELVDLTAKFVDRAANAVRTTLQSGG
jgi:hypothetical protein